MHYRGPFNKNRPGSQQSPHPKRESHPNNPGQKGVIRSPLAEKQIAQQFMRSFINMQPLLMQQASSSKDGPNRQQDSYPLAKHLMGAHLFLEEERGIEQKQGNLVGEQTAIGTVSKTGVGQADEESEYLNYLKEYETVVKSSRRRDYVSPMAHKKEMDQLITEFLSDMQDSESKSSMKSEPKCVTNEKKIKEPRSRSPNPDISVKIQRIDLTNIKNNSYNKISRKQTGKEQKQGTKRKQKEVKNEVKFKEIKKDESVSPRFAFYGDKISKEANKSSAIKYKDKNNDKVKIELIGVADMRSKIPKVKQIQPIQIMQQINKYAASTNGYSHVRVDPQKDSYLKKNLQKLNKAQERIVPSPKQSHKQPIRQGENQSKKPIKIEIEIPMQQFQEEHVERIQQYDVQSSVRLEHEQTLIIKQISQKVLSLLQKSSNFMPNKNK